MGRIQIEKNRDLRRNLWYNFGQVVSFNLHEEVIEQDKIYDYAIKLVSLGVLYMEFCDAIRKGMEKGYYDIGSFSYLSLRNLEGRITH